VITNAEMTGFLTKHGATARMSTDHDLWYYRAWQFGLPIGMAYLEMLGVVKRQDDRMKEIHRLHQGGFRYSKLHRAWYKQGKQLPFLLTRREALALLEAAA
jgi:hypothetical protein